MINVFFNLKLLTRAFNYVSDLVGVRRILGLKQIFRVETLTDVFSRMWAQDKVMKKTFYVFQAR